MLENIGSFSQLRFLRLWILVSYHDSDNILSLASFLRAAPLIDELEMHVSPLSGLHCASSGLMMHLHISYLFIIFKFYLGDLLFPFLVFYLNILQIHLRFYFGDFQ